MKIAVMQPYIFPYLGYFQLIDAVDNFIFYDDVNFIKKGFINRNHILEGRSNKKLFTIKLSKASQNSLINEVKLFETNSPLNGLIKQLKQNYSNAPYFDEVIHLVERINMANYESISQLAIESVILISDFLELKTTFELSSVKFPDSFGLDKTQRLIEICKKCNSKVYINSIGGMELYNKDDFLKQGIELFFIQSVLTPYKQFQNDSILGLSIIDLLMFNSKNEIVQMINKYKLI